MSNGFGTPPIDPILIPYVAATDEDDANRAAEVIFAEYTIRDVDRIVGFKTRSVRIDAQAASDVTSEVFVQLWIRLRKCRDGAEPIRCWSTYVEDKRLTTHGARTCGTSGRRGTRSSRIRYVIRNEDDLTLWQDVNGEWLCGLLPWRARPPVDSERLRGIVDGSLTLYSDDSADRAFTEGSDGAIAKLARASRGPGRPRHRGRRTASAAGNGLPSRLGRRDDRCAKHGSRRRSRSMRSSPAEKRSSGCGRRYSRCQPTR